MATPPWFVRQHVKSVYSDQADSVELVEPGPALVAAGRKLYDEQGDARRAVADAALFMYYGNARYALRGSTLANVLAPSDPPFRNVVKKYVQTKTAHIFRNQVRCYFITEGGNAEEREKAQGMTQAVEGQFQASGIYGYLGVLVCQDGQLFEGGVVKTITDVANNRVINDRVFPWEVFMPLEEARTGKPQQFFHRQLVDRSVLAGMFPDQAEEIAKATNAPDDWLMIEGAQTSQTSDLVAVWEAWHLPSTHVDQELKRSWGKDEEGKFTKRVDPGHDGRHVIALDTDGTTLVDEPWVYDHPPLALYLPDADPMGCWSISLPETLASLQLELLKLGKRVQAIINLHGRPLLGADRRAKVAMGKITNGPADILETNGSPASALQYIQPGQVPADVFRREEALDHEAGALAGISEMSVKAQKPPGIDHAPGLQHLSDEQSVRHTAAHRAWERFHVQLGINNVDAFRILSERKPDFEVMFGEAEALKRIKWKDVDLGRGKYQYRSFPTALLPSTPGAAADMALALLQGGVFAQTPEAQLTRRLLNFPDLKAASEDDNALERNVEKMLDRVEKSGMTIDTMPEPWNDPATCMRLAATRINRLQAQGAPEAQTEGLQDFHEAARRLQLRMTGEQAMAADPAAAGQMPPGGGGGGGAPPMDPAAAAAVAA